MKKIVFCCLLSFLFTANSYSQTVDLFDEADITQQTESNSIPMDVNQEINDEQSEANNNNDGIFSFITKPLSLMFSANDEVPTPEGKKETYLEKSTRQANEGNLEDQMNLGYMYLYGTNGVEQDLNKAFQYYTMASAQNDPIALNNLGSLYFSGLGTQVDTRKAMELFTKSAELGNDNAAINLAFIYLKGGSQDLGRNTLAMDLFQKANNAGNNVAKFMVGYAHYKGFILPKNNDKAFQLIQAAAGKGSELDEAQIILAEMYIKGHGTVQNYSSAIKSYRQAVSQGNIEAYMKLANLYYEGKITLPNPIMAHALYNVASSQEELGAEELRDEIGAKLKLEQLTQAQTIAQNFKPNPSALTLYVRQTFGFNIRAYIDMNISTTEKEIP